MAADFRAFSSVGNGQSVQANTFSITIPTTGPGGSVAAGDYATLIVSARSATVNLTTPTGWTAKGLYRNSSLSVWRFAKDSLVSGDIGATVSLVFSFSLRVQAIMLVASGVDPSGQAGFTSSESTATSSPTLPSASGIPAGSLIFGALSRSASTTPAATVHMPSSLAEFAPIGTAYGASPEMSMLGGWTIASSTSFSGTGTSSPATTGVNYLVVLPPAAVGGSPGTVTLATAQGTGSAVPLTINGTDTSVDGSSWPPDPYRLSVRSGGITETYMVSASLGGAPVPGAQDLRPVGGSIVDTTKPGVRRVLNLDLAPESGLADLLGQDGVMLTAVCRVQYQDRSTYDIPAGVYIIDDLDYEEGAGSVSITAPDKWLRIQEARFLVPQASAAGFPVVQQIAQLIQGAIPGEEVLITATSLATTPALVWERDRDKAIMDLAKDIGAWVYFDRQGGAVIADIPQLGASADWLVDASPTGVLTSLNRKKSRKDTRNVVVVTSSASGGPAFPPQIVWDNQPESPTYAGSNPLTNPGSAGPFGIAPEFYPSAVLSSASEAYQAGAAILSRTVGLAASVSLSQVPNPAMDAFQTIDVLRPKREFGPSPAMERYIADTVTHPLVQPTGGGGGNPLHIEARTIRIDSFISDLA